MVKSNITHDYAKKSPRISPIAPEELFSAHLLPWITANKLVPQVLNLLQYLYKHVYLLNLSEKKILLEAKADGHWLLYDALKCLLLLCKEFKVKEKQVNWNKHKMSNVYITS